MKRKIFSGVKASQAAFVARWSSSHQEQTAKTQSRPFVCNVFVRPG